MNFMENVRHLSSRHNNLQVELSPVGFLPFSVKYTVLENQANPLWLVKFSNCICWRYMTPSRLSIIQCFPCDKLLWSTWSPCAIFIVSFSWDRVKDQGTKGVTSMRFTAMPNWLSSFSISSLKSEYTISTKHIFALSDDITFHCAVIFFPDSILEIYFVDQQTSYRYVFSSAPLGSPTLFSTRTSVNSLVGNLAADDHSQDICRTWSQNPS